MMLSRLGNLILAVVVMSAPISLTVCEVLCASRSHEGKRHISAASMHSCHDQQPVGATGVVSGHVHACGHADELPVSSIAPGDVAAPVPAQTTVVLSPALMSDAPRVAPIETTSGPPQQHSRLPLRI
ncbi:MAG: hypothetical protein HOP16_21600 [Acidobacteria bacterium]|nr:hypothetical protein [Acidobacteriota bacterium]